MKLAIVGFGVEGQALLRYFSGKGHGITVLDRDERLKTPKNSAEIRFRLGPQYLAGLEEFDLVFRSPGIPYLLPEFDRVREKLTSLTKYFFEKCPCRIVGVTGTKGKGTTASLLYEMMRGGKTAQVFLGGNIGQPPLEFLDDATPQDLVILELSSFQLQDLDRSPHLAVVLGIAPDHMDHHQNMEEYIEAKKNIVKFQRAGDFAVLIKDNEIAANFEGATKAKIFHVSTKKPVEQGGFLKVGSFILKAKGGREQKTGIFIGEKGKTGLVGDHNSYNILAAATAANILGAPVEDISKAVREFRGLPHRLELIREIAGVRFYNDSASTNPETAIAAIRSFHSPLILIAGGSDKNTDFMPLGRAIAKHTNVKTVVLMGETKKKIEDAIDRAMAEKTNGFLGRREVPLELISAETYQEAFMVARLIAQPGDTVVLSPACASFDMFANYKERGDIFRQFVQYEVTGEDA